MPMVFRIGVVRVASSVLLDRSQVIRSYRSTLLYITQCQANLRVLWIIRKEAVICVEETLPALLDQAVLENMGKL